MTSFIDQNDKKYYIDCLINNIQLKNDFIKMYRNVIDWKLISNFQKFTLEQAKDYCDEINWSIYCKRDDIEEDIIDEYIDTYIRWDIISNKKNTQAFREKYKHKIKWETIIRSRKNEFTYEEYDTLCKNGYIHLLFENYYVIPFDLVIMHLDKIKEHSYHLVFERYQIDENHIMMMCNKFDKYNWERLSICEKIKLSNEFLKIYKDYIKWEYIIINKNYVFDDNMLEYAFSLIPSHDKLRKYFWNDITKAISTHHNISNNFIAKYPDLIDKKLLLENPYVSKDLCANKISNKCCNIQ